MFSTLSMSDTKDLALPPPPLILLSAANQLDILALSVDNAATAFFPRRKYGNRQKFHAAHAFQWEALLHWHRDPLLLFGLLHKTQGGFWWQWKRKMPKESVGRWTSPKGKHQKEEGRERLEVNTKSFILWVDRNGSPVLVQCWSK